MELNCENFKKNNPIIISKFKKKIRKQLMDLYYFMDRLGKISSKNNILVTDAGSNYYVGDKFGTTLKNGQREVSSYTNAAMGLTIPLAIGAAVASPRSKYFSCHWGWFFRVKYSRT